MSFDSFRKNPSFPSQYLRIIWNFLSLCCQNAWESTPPFPPSCLISHECRTQAVGIVAFPRLFFSSDVSPSFTGLSRPPANGGHCPVSRFPRSGLSSPQSRLPTVSRRVTSRGEGGLSRLHPGENLILRLS